jgi:hypothetical protein
VKELTRRSKSSLLHLRTVPFGAKGWIWEDRAGEAIRVYNFKTSLMPRTLPSGETSNALRIIYCRERTSAPLLQRACQVYTNLLHLRTPILIDLLLCPFPEHLLLWADAHSHIQEGLVQEWNARFQTPCHGGLVCAQAVRRVQVLNPLYGLFVECSGAWCSMEIEISYRKGVSV